MILQLKNIHIINIMDSKMRSLLVVNIWNRCWIFMRNLVIKLTITLNIKWLNQLMNKIKQRKTKVEKAKAVIKNRIYKMRIREEDKLMTKTQKYKN